MWLELVEGLERVCKLQLAVRPSSPVHRDESLVSRTFEPLKRMLPKRHALDYPCRVFSRNNGEEFLACLGSIEQEADPLILSLVPQVYGQDWPRGFSRCTTLSAVGQSATRVTRELSWTGRERVTIRPWSGKIAFP